MCLFSDILQLEEEKGNYGVENVCKSKITVKIKNEQKISWKLWMSTKQVYLEEITLSESMNKFSILMLTSERVRKSLTKTKRNDTE